MNQSHNLKFIDSTFEVQDAKEILGEVINEKINFHKKRLLFTEERFGEEDGFSKNRVQELGDVYQELQSILKTAAINGQNVKVTSTIKIELVAEPATVSSFENQMA